MLYTQTTSKLIASFTTAAVIGTTLPSFAEAPAVQADYYQSRPTIEQHIEDARVLLAHCEGSTSSLGAVDLLGTEPAGPGSEVLTDSLWGNLILQMAYARDKQLAGSTKKLRRTDNFTLASIYGISGVSLAQSIAGLATLNQGYGNGATVPGSRQQEASAQGEMAAGATEAHHHDAHGAGSEHINHDDSYAPGILGLIASGSTLAALGLRFYFGHRYSKQIKQRQQAIKGRVVTILARLEKGESPEQLRDEFVSLIGERAAKEFSQLWRASHQVAAIGDSG